MSDYRSNDLITRSLNSNAMYCNLKQVPRFINYLQTLKKASNFSHPIYDEYNTAFMPTVSIEK